MEYEIGSAFKDEATGKLLVAIRHEDGSCDGCFYNKFDCERPK